MPSNDKRRESARRQLERQLREREQRNAARKRVTLISSIVATVVVVVVVVVLIATLGGGSQKSAASSAPPSSTVGPSVTFDGVTVGGATVLAVAPTVTVNYPGDPSQLEYKDLVVGTGAAATDTSAVHTQYVGVVYKSGVVFDSSWKDSGAPVGFTLGPGNVIDGFTQGIGGTAAIPAMKVGGRRIIIMPASLGYGASPPSTSSIPANAALVFVVDLTSVTS